jgi:hypothetical protein
VQEAVVNRELSEGHARALLMLASRPEELNTVFKEIILKKTSVRMVEQLVRRIAQDKIRKHNKTPEMMELEKSLTETLGTRVVIENRPNGGRVLIEFFSPEDLSNIVSSIAAQQEAHALEMLQAASQADVEADNTASEQELHNEELSTEAAHPTEVITIAPDVSEIPAETPILASATIQVAAPAPEEDLYSVRNFSI